MTTSTIDLVLSGLSDPNNYPPQNALAVSGAFIVTAESSKIRWTNLTGGAVVDTSLYNVFAALPAAQRNSLLDARVVFDSINQRFVVMAMNLGSGVSNINIAVSKTANPNDGWWVGSANALLTINGVATYADMPYLSVDGANIYVSEPQYGSGLQGTQNWVFSHSIYDGGALTTVASEVAPPAQGIYRNIAGGNGLTYYVAVTPQNGQSVLSFQTYNVSNTLFSAFTTLALGNSDQGTGGANYTIEQQGTTLLLDAYDSRLASLAYSGNFLYGLSEVKLPGANTPSIHWFKLDVTNAAAPTVAAQGDITGAAIGQGVGVFNGSLAVDAAGDLLVNFTASSASMYPSDYYVYLAAGQTVFSAPVLYQASSGYFDSGAAGAQRWGAYSTAVADPADPNGFWISNEYVANNWWQTSIAQISLFADTSVNISISDVSIAEGNSGTKIATFTVSRTGTAAFSVNYATANGTATAGSDYVAASGALTFAQGQTSQTISVTINGDTTIEPDETFFVNLANPTNGGVLTKAQGVGTLTNDDVSATPVTFEKRVSASIDDVEQFASGSVYTNSSDLELTDDVQTTGGTGQTVGIRFTGVNIPVGATITNAYIQFQAKEVWTGATSVTIRADASANAAAFTTATNNVSSRTKTSASVGWTIAPWSTIGAAGVDQRTPDLTSVVQQIVNTSGWAALNSMAFIVTGSGTRTAWAYDGNAAAAPLLHIEYTMAPLVVGDISISDVLITEGDSGTKTATFTVSRTGTAAFAVNYATTDGTATAGSDYVAASGALTFAQGQTSQTISVTINGDTTVEPDETFFVNLTNATNGGVIAVSQGVGTITNDDAAPVVGNISISDVSIAEGNSGTKVATFTVSRTGTAAFSVNYATDNGTATAGSDYVATQGVLTFTQGQTSQTISVTINGDTTIEPDETFFVNLANPTNGGVLTKAQGVGTLTNDDVSATPVTFEKRVSASIDDVEQFASGSVYTNSSDLELTDDVQTTGGTGQTVGIRFTGVNIPVGATITNAYIQFQAKEVWTGATSVTIRADASANAAAFTTATNNVSSRTKTSASVGWSIAPWSTIGAAGVDQRTPDLTSVVQQIVNTSGWAALNSMAFIVTGSGTRTAWAYDGNAAAAPLLHIEYTMAPLVVGDISISDVSITEGDSGTKTATFTVSRTGTAAFAVNYATADGTATAGSDYVAASDALTFAQGQTSQTISVTINGDTAVEPDESFFVNLSNATNGGVIAVAQGVGTIRNDDGGGVNHQPTNIALTTTQSFKENVAGAVVGTLATTDDPGDTHTYTVDDSRFEVVGNTLKLKAGQRLDYERTPSVNLSVTSTDQGGLNFTKQFSVAVGDVAEVRFAAFGDQGGNGSGVQAVANLVSAMNVDFIVTTGDNVYVSAPIDEQIGRYYSNYIGNYGGAYGAGSAINRFFPTIGNHEYEDPAGGANAINYYNYFNLPDNERYYDFQMGSIHFFSLNNTQYEPDGYTANSTQARWLQSGLASSDAAFNLVLGHYPPYSSGVEHGSQTSAQWPFENWGATAVLSGHDHDYERVMRDDNSDGSVMPYFVTGLGGAQRYGFSTPVAGSQVRYNANDGTMLIQASDATITFEFWSVANGGTLIDTYTIDRQGADPLLASGDNVMNGSSSSDYMNGLAGNDRLEGKGGADTLIGGTGSDTFVFNPGFGKDVIADFTVSGSEHDTIEFSKSVFADWISLVNGISDSAQGAVITVDANTAITLSGVTASQLIANPADFKFV
ncbi:hypothetical protein M2323_003316 [Rhodoblastus acidophilus]|uniref:Calx-beta domain-containing protein n=1 Tax=Rhodoblastus acidophilus TaxID=1074 RepID=UPI00222583B2|nr:Calx-beta domain-containing protein [Rhodoblastus acidophilus]MCW2285377.1 hypothetical protein [Rhodoblastus acidophilus]MCW2334375.1 hypothetical protein [Rhodoblastus acidophilus]